MTGFRIHFVFGSQTGLCHVHVLALHAWWISGHSLTTAKLFHRRALENGYNSTVLCMNRWKQVRLTLISTRTVSNGLLVWDQKLCCSLKPRFQIFAARRTIECGLRVRLEVINYSQNSNSAWLVDQSKGLEKCLCLKLMKVSKIVKQMIRSEKTVSVIYPNKKKRISYQR
jgi:hypothetical protein